MSAMEAEAVEATLYKGSCQCGAVTFTAHTGLGELYQCNCSRCGRLNWVMTSVPQADFALLSGADSLRTYRFNTHRIDHMFCTVCGIQPFASGADGAGNPTYMINVNCLEGARYDRAAVIQFNGADF